MAQPATIFHGIVKDGKVTVHNQIGLQALIKKLEGKAVEVIMRKYVRRRTSPQLRYYWGVVIPILCENFGWESPEEMHDSLKAMFLMDHTATPPRVRSIADSGNTDVEQMTDFIEQIIIWAAQEHGCIIPPAERVEAA